MERLVLRNDVPPDRALDLVCTTEVDPMDAQRVIDSEYARLEAVDAMRIVVGVINRNVEPLGNADARWALNVAVDRDGLIREGYAGCAYPLSGLTPRYATGFPEGLEPYPHDPEEAGRLFTEAGWPEGRALRLACDEATEPLTRLFAEDYERALGISVHVTVIPNEDLLAAQHAVTEKAMSLPFDVLIQPWFDLIADAPPAILHREFYFSGGAFRAELPSWSSKT